jgi:hypothetical protein
MMPAHKESTKDKQVSQVSAAENFVLFIDLTSVTSSNLIAQEHRKGASLLAWPVPNRKGTCNMLN